MPSVTLRSFAKLNLDLRVLHKRPDEYHELRTVFQTIDLHDTITVDYERARRTRITLDDPLAIPHNLIARAAEAVLDHLRLTANIRLTLTKRIPMGAGLGGGSGNAAAILLALPALAGKLIPLETLNAIGARLGSDVPFFLYGGTTLGMGRGAELYPLPDLPRMSGILVAPGVHVSTAEAYRELARTPETLTTGASGTDTKGFPSVVWAMAGDSPDADWKSLCANDFEGVVFKRHPLLRTILKRLARAGARPARMTGSGSALFGLFDHREALDQALPSILHEGDSTWRVFRISLLSRRRYRSVWRRQLAAPVGLETTWPPRSRYSQR